MSDDSFDFKSFTVDIILNSLEKIFRSFALINTEVTDMTFCYERIKTEQDWSSNQFAVNASEFSA